MLPNSESQGKDSVDLIRDSLFSIQVKQPWLLLQYGNSCLLYTATPLVPKGHYFLKEIKKLTDSRQGVQAACEAKAAEAD